MSTSQCGNEITVEPEDIVLRVTQTMHFFHSRQQRCDGSKTLLGCLGPRIWLHCCWIAGAETRSSSNRGKLGHACMCLRYPGHAYQEHREGMQWHATKIWDSACSSSP
eukprot:1147588-Pelagomonas_calceolata.AAC.4